MQSRLLFSFAGTMATIGYILLAVFVLLVMVMIHELGHYTAGKLLKFKINEFSIGFGKAIFSKTNKAGEKISLRIFPLGGYCAFDGEDEEGEGSPTAFNNQKAWKRLIVLFCGAFFNFVSGIIFSAIFLMSFGYVDVVEVSKVYNKPIESEYIAITGQTSYDWLREGDVVYKVNGENTSIIKDRYFTDMISGFSENQLFTVTVKRDGKMHDIVMYRRMIIVEDETEGSLRVGANFAWHKFGFFEAIGRAFKFTFDWAVKVLYILWQLITGGLAITNLGGPVTTISTIAEVTSANFANLLLLLPIIAANLAVFNLLPFPALDGARMLFVLIEMIFRKPVNRKVEGLIHTIGLFILLGFVVVVDILHFII